MKKIIIALIALVAVAAAGLGCRGSGDSGQPVATSPSQGLEGVVPQTVQAIEGNAEDAIDMVLAGNWEQVSSDAHSIAADWADFLASSEGDSVTPSSRTAMEQAILDLKAASTAEDGLAARQAANDVSKVITDVFDLFNPKVPSDIGRLDYQERQVIIDAERGDWAAVTGDVSLVRETFDGVRQEVLAAGGEVEANAFEASVSKQEELAGSQDAAVSTEANIALELVDGLEGVI